MPGYNPNNYMNPNPEVRRYNGEYYMYTPTKIEDMGWGAVGKGGTVQKLTAEEARAQGFNENNTYNAIIDPQTWTANQQYSRQDITNAMDATFRSFDPYNRLGLNSRFDEFVNEAERRLRADPTKGDKVFGEVWNDFRYKPENAAAIQQLQNTRPEFTSQEQAGIYGQTGKLVDMSKPMQPQLAGTKLAMPGQGTQMMNSSDYATAFQQLNGRSPTAQETTAWANAGRPPVQKVSTAVADKLPTQVSSTISGNSLAGETPSPASFFQATGGGASTQTIMNIGNVGLSALDQAILSLNAQRQESAAAGLSAAEAGRTQALQGLQGVYATSRQDEIARIMQETGIKEKQAAISDLKIKMAQAQESLNLGLQQEGGRIAPMSIIDRRQQLLVEQAQGKIGALAAIANVYADDLDQAWNVANLTIDAMNQDRQERIDAYQFLLKMSDDKIVQLKAEEKEAIDSQISVLKEAQASAEANKDRVMNLILKNPLEAQKGKLSLTDSYEDAVGKITPFLAQRAEEEMRLAKIRSSSSRKASEPITFQSALEDTAQYLVDLRNSGKLSDLNYQQAITAFMSDFGYDPNDQDVRGEMESAINQIMEGRKESIISEEQKRMIENYNKNLGSDFLAFAGGSDFTTKTTTPK